MNGLIKIPVKYFMLEKEQVVDIEQLKEGINILQTIIINIIVA